MYNFYVHLHYLEFNVRVFVFIANYPYILVRALRVVKHNIVSVYTEPITSSKYIISSIENVA